MEPASRMLARTHGIRPKPARAATRQKPSASGGILRALATRILVIRTNSAFTCCPVVRSKRAVALRPEYCVWLKALYASHRSVKKRPSPFTGKRFESARSVLLTPGFRTLFLAALPGSFLPGTANAAGLNHEKNVEPVAFGSPTILMRWPSPPPGRSVPCTVLKPTEAGVPLTHCAMPDRFQSSNTHFTTLLS